MSNLLELSNTANLYLLLIAGLVILLAVIVIGLFIWKRRSRSHVATRPVETSRSAPNEAALTTPPLPALPVSVTLEFATDSGELTIFKLDKPVLTVGRGADNDIIIATTILNADTVSTHHARLRRDQDDYIVRDLGSKNGLTVNGRQTVENLLQDGDHIGFGKAEAVFHRPLASSTATYKSGSAAGGAA